MQACKHWNVRISMNYMKYVTKVREYTRIMSAEEAVELAITECIRDDILAKFLRKYRGSEKNMTIFEYNEEEHMRMVKAEGIAEGESCNEKQNNTLIKYLYILIKHLLEAERYEDLKKASDDPEFKDCLYRELGL